MWGAASAWGGICDRGRAVLWVGLALLSDMWEVLAGGMTLQGSWKDLSAHPDREATLMHQTQDSI